MELQSKMNIELIREMANVIIQWGLGLIIFGLATIVIGFVILLCLDIKTVRAIGNFLK